MCVCARACACVRVRDACVRACVRACVCVCVCVVSVIVKRPVLPPSVVDGRSRNPLLIIVINEEPADAAESGMDQIFLLRWAGHQRSGSDPLSLRPPPPPPPFALKLKESLIKSYSLLRVRMKLCSFVVIKTCY